MTDPRPAPMCQLPAARTCEFTFSPGQRHIRRSRSPNLRDRQQNYGMRCGTAADRGAGRGCRRAKVLPASNRQFESRPIPARRRTAGHMPLSLNHFPARSFWRRCHRAAPAKAIVEFRKSGDTLAEHMASAAGMVCKHVRRGRRACPRQLDGLPRSAASSLRSRP